jgi:hypothetical protein
VTTTLQSLRDLSLRRKIAAAVLALSLVGTGIASFAAVSDTLTQTNTFSVLNIDITASNDGTTFTQSLAQTWALGGAGQSAMKAVHIKNVGNGAAALSISGTGTGSASITGAPYRLYNITTASQCTGAGPDGSAGQELIVGGAASVGSVAPAAPLGNIAAGATRMFCQVVTPGTAPAVADTATQTLTWSAVGSL